MLKIIICVHAYVIIIFNANGVQYIIITDLKCLIHDNSYANICPVNNYKETYTNYKVYKVRESTIKLP